MNWKIKFGKTGVKLLKRRMAKSQRKTMSTWPETIPYRCVSDVDALSDGQFDHQFDIYYADPAIRNHLTVLDIHGGAYIANTRKINYGYATVFLENGFDVVVLDYPLNDGKQEIIEQVRVLAKQLCFLHDHAGEYELDPDTFFLTGDSAGGHFALLLAEAVCNSEIAGKLKLEIGDFSCRAVSVSCPVYDLEKAIRESPLNKNGLPELYGPSWNDAAYIRSISPDTYISSLMIPVFINTCRNDFLVEHSRALLKDLTDLDRNPEYLYLDDTKKEVTHVHNVNNITLEQSIQVNREMMGFFRRHAEKD